MGAPPALGEALGAAPGGATEAEKAEWVSVLTSCNLDSYFRTLAEQGIGSVGQLCAARAAIRAGQRRAETCSGCSARYPF